MKGFLGFALVLAMITVLFCFTLGVANNTHSLEQTKNELIKAEQANKERTLLENSTDKIIYTKLQEQILIKNFNVATAQNAINTALGNYFRNKAYASSIFREKTGEASASFLNQNSNVEILQANGLVYAEYIFTSNLIKTSTVSAKLGNKIITYFEIPAGRSTRIIQPSP